MNNKVFRLFVSSTFNDFLQEREILNKYIYKKVKMHCQKYGYSFQIIDLRWGVSTESALNQKTLEICLDEVKRCRSLSPKPNFLIMVGERYGWIPLPYSISANEYEKIYNICNEAEKQILDKWYFCDENSIEVKYVLAPRTREFEDDDVWRETENKIRNILVSKAEECNFSEEEMVKYITSATEHEILTGFMEKDERNKNVVTLFRNNYDESEDVSDKIESLRGRIRNEMESDECIGNMVELDYNDRKYFALVYKYIKNILIRNIDEEIARLDKKKNNSDFEIKKKKVNNFEKKKQELEVYTDNYLYERKEEIKQLNEYICGSSNKVYYVFGESGSGKTTLLANFLVSEFLQQNGFYFIASFYGMNERSYTIFDAISHICNTLCERFSLSGGRHINRLNMAEEFIDLLYSVPENEKVVILIDGLDNFYDIDDIKENIFPDSLPENVKLIVSSAQRKYIDKFLNFGSEIMTVKYLDEGESNALFHKLMSRQGRRLVNPMQKQIVNDAISHGCTPLQLKLMSITCKGWNSTEMVEPLRDTAEGIALAYIEDMYKKYGHNKDFVINAMALIAASPYGITEAEMQRLSFKIADVQNKFYAEDRYGYGMNKIPFVIWSRLFYDLNDCVMLASVRGQIVVKFSHNIFYKVVNEQFGEYVDDARKLLTEYYAEKPTYVVQKNRQPDTRKIVNLVALYELMGKNEELCRLMAETDSADAALKTMSVDEVIRIYSELVHLKKSEYSEKLEKILYCIRDNRAMLSCYRGEFYQCAGSNFDSIDDVPILEWKKDVVGDEYDSLFMQYSVKADIEWSPEATRYAVYSKSYIYICEMESQREVARIFLGIEDGHKLTANKILWIDENTFLVYIYGKKICIYNIRDNSLKKITEINHPAENSNIMYSHPAEVLIIPYKNELRAYKPMTGELLYSITVDKFMIDDKYNLSSDERKINVMCRRQRVKIYDIQTGRYLTELKFRTKNRYQDITSQCIIYQISEEKWLAAGNVTEKRVVMFDSHNGKYENLIPPLQLKVNDLHICGKYLICEYDDMIVCIDLLNSYKMSSFMCEKIYKVSYIEAKNMLAVTSENKIYIVPIDRLNQLDGECSVCMTTDKNFNYSLDAFIHLFGRTVNIFPALVDIYATAESGILKYKAMKFIDAFSTDEFKMLVNMFNEKRTNATIAVVAEDGKRAIAYEENDEIRIFDKNGHELWVFDKLELSIDNSILDIFFFDNAQYICIWRNYSVKVVRLDSGKCVLDLNLSNRSALSVHFSEEKNSLTVVLCDYSVYDFKMSEIKSWSDKVMPKKVESEVELYGPYMTYCKENKIVAMPIMTNLSRFDIEREFSEWFIDDRRYSVENKCLHFSKGIYFPDGEKAKVFNSIYCNFLESLQTEREKDATKLISFLREKNDIMSRMIEVGNRFIILVSRLLNSVIVFDCEIMSVITAYKHHGQIIGEIYYEKDRVLELLSNEIPYNFKIKINLI